MGGGEKLHIFSCVLLYFVPFASYITGQIMWNLALNHAKIFQNSKQSAKCVTMNYFQQTILGLVGTIAS